MPRDDIRAVERRHSAQVLGTPGVSGFDVGENENGAYFFVIYADADHPELAASLPREIEGYPVHVESAPGA